MIDLPVNQIVCGDCRQVMAGLPAGSVHCVVTSPPYWGLRDYGVDGQLGLEPSPDEYIAKMVEVFRAVRRVLRDDGSLWLNVGDSYANDTKWGGSTGGKHVKALHGQSGIGRQRQCTGLKPKDLCGIPWRLALALQADGWWLRQDIIWNKPNPMPESTTDRCTKAHEYIFLLTKRARYFYDAEAVKETGSPNTHSRGKAGTGPDTAEVNYKTDKPGSGNRNNSDFQRYMADRPVGTRRNKRSVWTIPTAPFKEAHFATFPPELVRPCLLAGTSEHGCCPACGAPWVRVVEKKPTGQTQKMPDGFATHAGDHGSIHRDGREKGKQGKPVMKSETVGWRPTCDCEEPNGNTPSPVPCIVFDPFMGAGTVGVVAVQEGRHWVGIELNAGYAERARRRIARARPGQYESGNGEVVDGLPLFASSE